MNPRHLLPPDNPLGYPTPFWFIQFFKVLGFALHVSMMNIWYAGAPLAIILATFGTQRAKAVGHHIARALPFVLALGINFGIIPLLFMQVAYYQFFYSATILIAWPWFAVFWVVMMGYASVYLYRLSLEGKFPAAWGRLGGWLAAGLFLVVGLIFSAAMSLLAAPDRWWKVFSSANVAGAPTGLILDFSDPTLVPRWLFMFGIAITTTAAFVMLDAAYMSSREDDTYHGYAARFSAVLYTLGIVWFAGFGSWYIFGTRPFAFSQALADPIMRIIFPITMVSPGLPWILIMLQWNGPRRLLAALTGFAQFGVIALNGVSRQWLQNVEIGRYVDLAAKPVDLQLSAMVVFLVFFAAGIGIIAWITLRIIRVNRAQA